MHKIEKLTGFAMHGSKERLTIRGFKTGQAMHEFLNAGANALTWRETTKDLKPGTYAFVGGQWHNVKSLDPMTLAHC